MLVNDAIYRPGCSFTKGRKFCRRRRRKRRLYVRMYVCVDCVLLKVVTTHVNVDTHVDFVVVYVWNSFEGGTKTILTTNATHAYCILSLSPLSSARSIMTDKKPRKPNWSEGEMCVLADACLSFNQIIRGKFSPSLTSEMKKKAWETITDK